MAQPKSKKIQKPRMAPQQASSVPKPKHGFLDINQVCLKCRENLPIERFYQSSGSKIWTEEIRFPICKDCLLIMFHEISEDNNNNDVLAMGTICHYLDVPFFEKYYDDLRSSTAEARMGAYLQKTATFTLRDETFMASCTNIGRPVNKILEKGDVDAWSYSDKKNRSFVISIVGYPPFDDDGYREQDKIYCYNTMAGYCDNETIGGDMHKVQGCISIVKASLQMSLLEERIFAEIKKNSSMKNGKEISEAVGAKKNLQSIISSIARENNIASAYSKESTAGQNTFSGKIKFLSRNGYEAIKENMYDIRTSDAIQQVAQLSANAIIESLKLDDNDLTKMIREQREMLVKSQSEADKFREENRILTNRLLQKDSSFLAEFKEKGGE